MTDRTDLKDKIVVITGTSRGIGYAAAIEAARRGAHVVAVARSQDALTRLDDAIGAVGGAATLVPLDLTDYAGIDRLGAALFERWGRLDGLIGNAGLLGSVTPVPHLDPEEFEQVLSVNVTVNYRLIRAFDLLLRKAPAGRAVFVSSSSAKSARAYWGLYAASKAALDALVKSYAAEMTKTEVRANVFYPGPVSTDMRAAAVPGEDPATLPTPAEIAPALVDMISPDYLHTRKIYNAVDTSLTDL